jgi:hypothetical protein
MLKGPHGRRAPCGLSAFLLSLNDSSRLVGMFSVNSEPGAVT